MQIKLVRRYQAAFAGLYRSQWTQFLWHNDLVAERTFSKFLNGYRDQLVYISITLGVGNLIVFPSVPYQSNLAESLKFPLRKITFPGSAGYLLLQ